MKSKSLIWVVAGVLILSLCIAIVPVSATVTVTGPGTVTLGQDITFTGTNDETGTTYLVLDGPGLPTEGANISSYYPKENQVYDLYEPSFASASVGSGPGYSWSWTWHTNGITLDAGTYTLFVETEARDLNHITSYATYSVVVIKPFSVVDISSPGDHKIAVGQSITFEGTNWNTSTTYLFLTGPGLSVSGAQLNSDPAASPVSQGVAGSFTQASVNPVGHTWSYTWQTTEEINLAKDSVYTVYAENSPEDAAHLIPNNNAPLAFLITRPWISASADHSAVLLGDPITISGSKGGADSPAHYIYITVTNNFTPYYVGDLPTNGVKPDNFAIESISGDPSTFGVATISGGTWSYTWPTTAIPKGDDFFVIVSMYPLNRTDAFATYGSYTKIGVAIISSPHADYIVNRTSGTAPLTVEFTDISTGGGTDVWWDFGDGTTLGNTSNVVTHTYTKDGSYYPVIHVSNYDGSDYRTNDTIFVNVPPPTSSLYIATKTVINNVIPQGDVSDKVLSGSQDQKDIGSTIGLLGGRDPILLTHKGHVIRIDNGERANGDHPVQYVQVDDENQETYVYDTESLSSNIDFVAVAGNVSYPGGDPGTVGDPNSVGSPSPSPDGGLGSLSGSLVPICDSPECSKNYALLIDGGIDANNNHIRYWNDISFMYQLLTRTYGYQSNHIKVLMSDGNDGGVDRHYATTAAGAIQTDDSSRNLDSSSDGSADYTLSATRNNLNTAFSDLNTAMPSDGTLFIFTTGHGGNDTTHYSGINSSLLYLWGADAYINDTEFVNALPTKPANITIVMEQCNSGGFVDNFIDNYGGGQKRVIATAANGSEPSWGNAFSNAWMAGVGRIDIGQPPGADTSRDSRISMKEAFDFANTNDLAAVSTLPKHEHPQYRAKTTGSGDSQFLSTCAAASIKVLSPNGGENWYKGYYRNISWLASGISGNVDIKLYNKTSNLVQTIATRPASDQTYKWAIDNTTIVYPGTDYYITISTSAVNDRSDGTFTISSYSKPGKIKINSVPIPNSTVAGATVWLDGIKKNGFVTNLSLSADPGSHIVSVTKAGFYDSPAVPALVPSGDGTQFVGPILFTLVEGGFSNTPGDPDYQSPAGKLYITSTYLGTPMNARILVGGELTDLQTNKEISFDPETYDISLKVDGYQAIPAVKTVTVISQQTIPLSFTLSPDPDWYKFTGFDAPVDMSTDSILILNTAKAGSNIPIKWHLSDGNGYVSTQTFSLMIDDLKTCPGSLTDEIEVVDTSSPVSTLTYQGSGAWHYNWKTVKGITGCKRVYLKYDNGWTSPAAVFKFR
jgi:PKD repeat protein